MLPNPRLFRSRWAALLWAGGILWFAYDVGSSAPHGQGHTAASADADTPNAADVAAITNLLD